MDHHLQRFPDPRFGLAIRRALPWLAFGMSLAAILCTQAFWHRLGMDWLVEDVPSLFSRVPLLAFCAYSMVALPLAHMRVPRRPDTWCLLLELARELLVNHVFRLAARVGLASMGVALVAATAWHDPTALAVAAETVVLAALATAVCMVLSTAMHGD